MVERQFNPGDIIIAEESFGNTAFILKSGTVSVTKKGIERDVELATISAEAIFGELGLIEDRPRSASVIAKTKVIVDEITRDDFFPLLDDKAAFVIPIFKALFERLRQTNERVIVLEHELHKSSADTKDVGDLQVQITGMTREAKTILNDKSRLIKNFPYKIGRQSHYSVNDIFVDNDLYIEDERPYNVSRNHLSINVSKGEYYILDRGSSLGTIVNGNQLGGKSSLFKSDLKKGENIVIIGSENSPYVFRIDI